MLKLRIFKILLMCFVVELGFAQTISLSNLENNIGKLGNTIDITDGNYHNIIVNIRDISDVVIRPKNKQSVRITGKSSFIFTNCSNVKFEGFVFENISSNTVLDFANSSDNVIKDNIFRFCGVHPTGGAIIRLRPGSDGNSITHNTFEGNRTLGVVIMTGNNDGELSRKNVISSNHFFNIKSVKSIYQKSNGNGMECIQIGSGANNKIDLLLENVVSNNLFANIIGDGSEIISIKSSGNIISSNIFDNNRSGITFRYGNNNVLKDNVFLKTMKGIRVFGAGHVMENNIFVGGDFGIQLPAGTDRNKALNVSSYYSPSDNIRIDKNIFFQQKYSGIVLGNYKSGINSISPQNIAFNNNYFQDIQREDVDFKDSNIRKTSTYINNRSTRPKQPGISSVSLEMMTVSEDKNISYDIKTKMNYNPLNFGHTK